MRYLLVLLLVAPLVLAQTPTKKDMEARAAWAWAISTLPKKKPCCLCDCVDTKICTCGDACACPACAEQERRGIPFAGTTYRSTLVTQTYVPSRRSSVPFVQQREAITLPTTVPHAVGQSIGFQGGFQGAGTFMYAAPAVRFGTTRGCSSGG